MEYYIEFIYLNILKDKLEFQDEIISNNLNEEIYPCNINLELLILNQTIDSIFDRSLYDRFKSSEENSNYQNFMDVKGRFYDQENNIKEMYEDKKLMNLPEQTPRMFSR
ncbi:unnamed protein product [Gordionus sp. m RMFG-2023]